MFHYLIVCLCVPIVGSKHNQLRVIQPMQNRVMDEKLEEGTSAMTVLPPVQPQRDDCRLWIGNLDPKVTEYAMLKLLQRFSVTIRSFDFMYHRSGPEKGQPRGYCFVTLSTPEEATTIVGKLNGKMALSRRLVVKYAEIEKRERPAPAVTSVSSVPQLSTEVPKSVGLSVEGKIHAIEEKLKMMDKNKDGSTPPVILYPPPANIKHQQELAAEAAERTNRRNRSEFQYRRPAHRRRPYQRRGR